MAYEDWMPEFQQIWDLSPADELNPRERVDAEELFEEGFMTYEGEARPADIQAARELFFEMMGEEYESYFDWQGWREAMGYE
jgi:hypothetical protein